MEMVRLKSGMRKDGFDRFSEALRVIREGSGNIEAMVFELLQKLPGLLPIFRRCFMGHEDAVMLILHHHHTMVRTQRVVAVNMTLSRRGDGKQLPQHLLWRGPMRANVINPSFNRRLGNGNQEQCGKEESTVPKADPTDHREVTGQSDHAFAHMLGGRDAFDLRGEEYPLVLAIQVGPLR